MFRIRRDKTQLVPGLPYIPPPKTHYALVVDPLGNVSGWTDCAERAAQFDQETVGRVMAFYAKNHVNAGVLTFEPLTASEPVSHAEVADSLPDLLAVSPAAEPAVSAPVTEPPVRPEKPPEPEPVPPPPVKPAVKKRPQGQ